MILHNLHSKTLLLFSPLAFLQPKLLLMASECGKTMSEAAPGAGKEPREVAVPQNSILGPFAAHGRAHSILLARHQWATSEPGTQPGHLIFLLLVDIDQLQWPFGVDPLLTPQISLFGSPAFYTAPVRGKSHSAATVTGKETRASSADRRSPTRWQVCSTQSRAQRSSRAESAGNCRCVKKEGSRSDLLRVLTIFFTCITNRM